MLMQCTVLPVHDRHAGLMLTTPLLCLACMHDHKVMIGWHSAHHAVQSIADLDCHKL